MSHAVKTRSEKATLAARRTVCYAALVLLSFLCLFFFYVLGDLRPCPGHGDHAADGGAHGASAGGPQR